MKNQIWCRFLFHLPTTVQLSVATGGRKTSKKFQLSGRSDCTAAEVDEQHTTLVPPWFYMTCLDLKEELLEISLSIRHICCHFKPLDIVFIWAAESKISGLCEMVIEDCCVVWWSWIRDWKFLFKYFSTILKWMETKDCLPHLGQYNQRFQIEFEKDWESVHNLHSSM